MKLVRNKIPSIIEDSGGSCTYRIADKEEMKDLLFKKLEEESKEFIECPSLMEAADMYEVFLSILSHWGIDFSSVVNHSYYKREARGSFDKGVVLIESSNKKEGT